MAALPTSSASSTGNLQLRWDHVTAAGRMAAGEHRLPVPLQHLVLQSQSGCGWPSCMPPPNCPLQLWVPPPLLILPILPGCCICPPPQGTSAHAFLLPPAPHARGAGSVLLRVQEGQRLFPVVFIGLCLLQIALFAASEPVVSSFLGWDIPTLAGFIHPPADPTAC